MHIDKTDYSKRPLLCMDFETWVVSDLMNKKKLTNKELIRLDDGYTLRSLAYILKELRIHKQKITFFLVFKLEELFPGIIDTILKDGHEVGWHSYSHSSITSEDLLIDELDKSKKFLKKYNILGFQAPQIIFFREGYKILKKYGFNYSSSIYGNSDILYEIDGIYEIPVSVSNTTYRPEQSKLLYPSSLTFVNLLNYHVPYGSSYFWGLLGQNYYSWKLSEVSKNKSIANLFIHNWQIVLPQSQEYKKEYRGQIGIFHNPLFYPYTISVSSMFTNLISNFSFQSCHDYLNEKIN